ncbi:MAG: ABC transporter substrate-binding protein [Rhizobiaceae bacterium]
MKNLALVLLIGLCTSFVSSPAISQDTFNVRYSWKLKGEYAPFYVAQDNGYFKERHLEVRLGEGAGASAALAGLLQGQEDVVVLPAVFALTAISKGMPVKIVALYHPAAPLAIVSHPDKPISVPKDLEGKTLAVATGDTIAAYLPVLCKLNDVDCTKVGTAMMAVGVRGSQFLARQVDGFGMYLNTDFPILQSQVSKPLVTLKLSDYGLPLPGLSIVTSDSMIAGSGDRLRRFMAAVGQGMENTRADPDGATKALLRAWSSGPSEEFVKIQIEETLAAIPFDSGKPVGWIDPKAIEGALWLLKEGGEIDTIMPSATYYTNVLVE